MSQGIDFHPLDKEIALKFNAGKKKPTSANYKLNGQLSPLPFHGSPEGARVVILMSNPGIDKDNTDLEKTPEIQSLLDLSRKHQLQGNQFAWLREEFQGKTGQKWWKSRTRVLREEVGDEVFQSQTFAAEIHPYYSVNYKNVGEEFPTTRYTKWLIEELMQDGVAVLIRSKAWIEAMPALEDYPNLFRLKNPQSSFITPKNIDGDGFARLASFYKR